MNIKKILVWTVIFLAAYAGYTHRAAKQKAEVPVEIKRGKLEKHIFAEGKVIPEVEVELSTKVPGRIKVLYAKEGDTVTKGQAICVLDNGELQAQLQNALANVKQAKARLQELKTGARVQEVQEAEATVKQIQAAYDESQKNLKRQQALFDEHAIPQSALDMAKMQADMDKQRLEGAKQRLSLIETGPKKESIHAAQAAVAAAQAGVTLARENLENSIIRAPITGEVIVKYKENGEMISPGVPILRLADKSNVYVRAEVDESDIGWLKLEQKVVITSDAYPDKTYRGKVTFIGESIGKREIVPEDPTKISDAKVLDVKVLLEPGHPFKLGMTVDSELHVFEKDDVLLLPKDAVIKQDDKTLVRKFNGKAEVLDAVTLGTSDDMHAEIVCCLEEGDKVFLKKNGSNGK